MKPGVIDCVKHVRMFQLFVIFACSIGWEHRMKFVSIKTLDAVRAQKRHLYVVVV